MVRRRFCALDCTDCIVSQVLVSVVLLRNEKKKAHAALTANQYGSEFAADHDCEMRPDRHCMCKDESAISALSGCLVQQQRGRTSWRLACNEGGVNSTPGGEG